MALDAGPVQSLLELREKLLACPNLMRFDTAVKAERRKPTHHLADVPLDRMKPVAAVGDVGGTNVLCCRQEVTDPDGQQSAQRDLERDAAHVDVTVAAG